MSIQRLLELRNTNIVVRKSINSFLLTGLVVFSLLTPADSLGFKKIFLGLVLFFNFDVIINGYIKSPKFAFITVFIPIYILCISLIFKCSLSIIVSGVYIFAYLPIAFVIEKQKFDISSIVIVSTNIIAFIIVFSAFLDFIGIVSIYSNPILYWLRTNSEAQISKSQYAMFLYVIFLKASPILLYNFVHYLKNRRYVLAIYIFLAVIFTGTRANIFTCAFILLVYILLYEPKNWIKYIALLMFGTISIRYGTQIMDKIYTIFWAKSKGDSIRIDTIKYVLIAINQKWYYWITGMGVGSEYYIKSEKRSGFVITSELSYLEYIRTCGLIVAGCVFYFIAKPLRYLFKKEKSIFLFYISYLVQGCFEPFIFTSTGFFVIMLMYVQMKNQNSERLNDVG